MAITDHYLAGTRLRLRRTVENGAVDTATYKLAQKVPGPGGGRGLTTNLYLSADEYELLLRLPGERLEKVRYNLVHFGLDEFSGRLRGLVLAEAEFESDADMAQFRRPDWAVAEVTDDERFTGGNLAHTSRAELIVVLSDFGVVLAD